MNTINKIIFLLLFTCVGCQSASAANVPDLYSATVPVATRSASDRQQAIQQTLNQVFIKVSGNASIAQLAPIKESVTNAKHYLQQFSYLQKQDPQNESTLLLQAKFNKKAINAVLSGAGQPIWGNNRPFVLVWLALTDNSSVDENSYNQVKPTLVGSDSNLPLRKLLQSDAKNRGLPIMLPILDLQDMQAATVDDVWSLNLNAIERASSRYGSDAIVVGRVTPSADGQWQSQWLLVTKANQLNWNELGTTLDQVVAAGLNDVTSALASRYAVTTTDTATEQNVRLTVSDINNLESYAKVKQYLSKLSPVDHFEVEKVEPNEVIFDLALKGSQYALVQAISLNHSLQPMPMDYTDSAPTSAQSVNLYYKFVL